MASPSSANSRSKGVSNLSASLLKIDYRQPPLRIIRHLPPSLAVWMLGVTTVDQLDGNALIASDHAYLFKAHVRVLIGLLIADHEDELQRLVERRPAQTLQSRQQHPCHVFRIAATGQRGQSLGDRIQILGEIRLDLDPAALRIIPWVTVAQQREAQRGRRLESRQVVDDLPEIQARRLDE